LPLLPTIGEHILELLTGLHWTCMLWYTCRIICLWLWVCGMPFL
jgi:hypothetical protein